jgi:hypothetical protein
MRLVRRCTIVLAVLGVAVAAASQPAQAVPITFGFTAVVTEFESSTAAVDETIVGTNIHGSYTFESTAKTNLPWPSFTIYENAVTHVRITIGEESFASQTKRQSGSIWVWNDVDLSPGTEDGYLLIVSLLDENFFLVSITAETQGSAPPMLFTDSSLPLEPPELARATHAEVGFETESFKIRAQPTSLFLVPEPSTVLLLSLGVGLLLAFRSSKSGVDFS